MLDGRYDDSAVCMLCRFLYGLCHRFRTRSEQATLSARAILSITSSVTPGGQWPSIFWMYLVEIPARFDSSD